MAQNNSPYSIPEFIPSTREETVRLQNRFAEALQRHTQQPAPPAASQQPLKAG